jgi:hypothetical protein
VTRDGGDLGSRDWTNGPTAVLPRPRRAHGGYYRPSSLASLFMEAEDSAHPAARLRRGRNRNQTPRAMR